MADKDKNSTLKEIHKKQGLFHFLKHLFCKNKSPFSSSSLSNKKAQLEPKYWPEVIELKETLEQLVLSHTKKDENVRHINEQILTYIQKEINKKGAIADIDARYTALETIADRILTEKLNNLAGLQLDNSVKAEFTEAINTFKEKLSIRYRQEIAANNSAKTNSPSL